MPKLQFEFVMLIVAWIAFFAWSIEQICNYFGVV